MYRTLLEVFFCLKRFRNTKQNFGPFSVFCSSTSLRMGIVSSILLGVAAKVFAVEVDERIPLVRECLPGR
mgnify:CR=1 FL=1